MRILTTIIFTIVTFSFFAQDIIIQHSGDEIKTKILEVNETNIKYKKFENIEGPTYTMEKSSIFMIKYENGSKDVFKTDNTAQKSTKPPKVKSTFDFKANRRGGYLGIRIAGGINSKASNDQGYKASLDYANYFNSNIGFRTGISLDYYKAEYIYSTYYRPYYKIGNAVWVGMPVKLMVTTNGRFGYYFEGGPTFYWYSGSLSSVNTNYPFLRMEFGMTHGVRYDINKNLTINGGMNYMVISSDAFTGAQLGLMLKL